MRYLIISAVVVILLLLVVNQSVEAVDFWDAVDPDAALIAEPIGVSHDSLFGASKIIDELDWFAERRWWADLFQPFDDIGVGTSLDVSPGKAVCFGVGWQQEWFGYVGAHVEF